MATESKWSDQKTAIAAAPTLQSCADGKNWIASNNQLLTAAGFVDEFNQTCMQRAASAFPQVVSTLTDLDSQVARSQLQIFGRLEQPKASTATLWGEFLTLLLLSLGAPFWYNALRQLSNLKPSVSQKIKEESTPTDTTTTQKAAGAAAGS